MEKRILIVPCGRAFEENREPNAEDDFFLVEADYKDGELDFWEAKNYNGDGISPFEDECGLYEVNEEAWESFLSKSKYSGKGGYKKMLADLRATEPITQEDAKHINTPFPMFVFFEFPRPSLLRIKKEWNEFFNK